MTRPPFDRRAENIRLLEPPSVWPPIIVAGIVIALVAAFVAAAFS